MGSSWAALRLPLLLSSLHELVKHGENGLVFEDAEELASQLQVMCLPMLQLGGWCGVCSLPPHSRGMVGLYRVWRKSREAGTLAEAPEVASLAVVPYMDPVGARRSGQVLIGSVELIPHKIRMYCHLGSEQDHSLELCGPALQRGGILQSIFSCYKKQCTVILDIERSVDIF